MEYIYVSGSISLPIRKLILLAQSFYMDVLTKEQRRKNMQAIKANGTKDEIILAKALWHKGLRYRKNDKGVFGKPDLTFRKLKIAIFVDSEFFHGKDWEVQKHRIKSNRDFWWNKIESNIKRDEIVNNRLKEENWFVIRFWSSEIRKKLANCISLIEKEIKDRYGNL